MSTLYELASREALRMARTGRGFSLVRIAPAGWLALEDEIDVLRNLAEAHLRKTDAVVRVRQEIGVVLTETTGADAIAAVARLRPAVCLPKLEVRIGWAAVMPGQRWEEAWRWAGQLLVADAAIPAAA